MQTYNNRLLKIIGRPHREKDVIDTLNAIRDAKYDNYSLDLIYGIPSQTLDELRDDIRRAIDTGATHISAFKLEIIPMTAMHIRAAIGDIPRSPDPEFIQEMDALLREEMSAAGLVEYGVFNFVKPGYESIHNDIAFGAPQDSYIGFGNSSYSCINSHIFTNHAVIEDYVDAVESTGRAISKAKYVTALEHMSRFFVLGLKFLSVKRSDFIAQFGIDPHTIFGEILDSLVARDLLIETDDGWALTVLGRHYVNNVCKEFYVGDSIGHRQHVEFVPTLTADSVLHLTKKAMKLNPEAELAE